MNISSRSLKAIARHLTGMEYQEMLAQYRRGTRIATPNGRTVSREGFKVIAQYLGKEVLA